MFWCFLSADITVYLYIEVTTFPPCEIFRALLQSDAVRPCSSQINTEQELLLPGVVCNARDQSREGGWQSTPRKALGNLSHHKRHQLARRLLWEHVVDAGERHCSMETLSVWDVKAALTKDLRSHDTGRSPLCRETSTSTEYGWRLFWKQEGERITPTRKRTALGMKRRFERDRGMIKSTFVWRKAYFCSQQRCHHMCTSWSN